MVYLFLHGLQCIVKLVSAGMVMDDTAGLYDFDEKDEKGEGKDDFKKIIVDNWTEPSRLEQKRNYSESDYFKQAMRAGPAPKPREPLNPKL